MADDDRDDVKKKVMHAVSMLCEGMDPSLIPEVGTNIVYALQNARDPGDVAGVAGRIVSLKNSVHPVGEIEFGASDHVARIALTAMKFDPRIRSAANIRYSPEYIELLDEMLFTICSFDRSGEPPGVRSMDWGVASCCRDGVPDIIYDRGAVGKEPMIRILGEEPIQVAHNILKLSRRIKNTKI